MRPLSPHLPSGQALPRPALWPDRLEGLLLAALGGFMAALSQGRLYWYFLNPRFAPLTLGAGVVIILAGLTLLFAPRPGVATGTRLLRPATLLLFLCLATASWRMAGNEAAAMDLGPAPRSGAMQSVGTAGPSGSDVSTGVDATGDAPRPKHRETIDGVEYLRLNLAELYIMLDKGRKDYPPHFAIRAQVVRNAALDAQGLVLLDRIAVTCCLADSLELRFFTTGIDAALPGLKSGDWVEVFGSLEPMKKAEYKALHAIVPKAEGPSLALENPGFRVEARHAARITPPDFPYLFEFREKEPFAW